MRGRWREGQSTRVEGVGESEREVERGGERQRGGGSKEMEGREVLPDKTDTLNSKQPAFPLSPHVVPFVLSVSHPHSLGSVAAAGAGLHPFQPNMLNHHINNQIHSGLITLTVGCLIINHSASMYLPSFILTSTKCSDEFTATIVIQEMILEVMQSDSATQQLQVIMMATLPLHGR